MLMAVSAHYETRCLCVQMLSAVRRVWGMAVGIKSITSRPHTR